MRSDLFCFLGTRKRMRYEWIEPVPNQEEKRKTTTKKNEMILSQHQL